MIALFWVLCALVSFVIAALAVGSVTGVQAQRPLRAVYVVEDAVTYVADHLPDDVSAQVSYDDVRAVVDAQIGYLGAWRRGAPSTRLPTIWWWWTRTSPWHGCWANLRIVS